MWVPWRSRQLVIPIIPIGQSPEWMEILECSPHVAVRRDDSVTERELREHLGDLVFLASRLLRENERLKSEQEHWKVECAASEMEIARLKAPRSWTP